MVLSSQTLTDYHPPRSKTVHEVLFDSTGSTCGWYVTYMPMGVGINYVIPTGSKKKTNQWTSPHRISKMTTKQALRILLKRRQSTWSVYIMLSCLIHLCYHLQSHSEGSWGSAQTPSLQSQQIKPVVCNCHSI